MGPILMLSHGEGIPPGHLGDALEEAGLESRNVDVHGDEPLPGGFDWRAVVSLGGQMGAYEEDRYPWLGEEKRFLAGAVAEGIPTLGICLGCQMLADALGGRAYPAPRPEIGVLRLELTETGRADGVVSQLTGPVPVWHGDTWDLPPGGSLLARTDRHPHAFRLGSALGVQGHPEASPEIIAGWVRMVGTGPFAEAGTDPGGYLEELRGNEEEIRSQALRFFGAWLGTL